MTTATSHQDNALTIKSELRDQLEKIDADADLTSEAKARSKAAAYVRAKQQLSEIQANERAERDSRRRSLERRLFGMNANPSSTDAISFRDAQDRAAQLGSSSEVRIAMDRALLTGDTHLAKAVLSRGMELGVTGIEEPYLAEHPADRPLLAELRTATSGLADDLLAAFAYNVEPPRGMTDLQAQRIAGDGQLTGAR